MIHLCENAWLFFTAVEMTEVLIKKTARCNLFKNSKGFCFAFLHMTLMKLHIQHVFNSIFQNNQIH